MKNIFLIVLLFMTSILLAQESTLVGNNLEHGGFGGPVIKFTQINGEFGVLVGGRGGWIIGHKFVLGLGGYGLANNIAEPNITEIDNRITMGYGGLEMEYIVNSDDIIHFSVQVLIGGGTVTHTGLFDNDWEWDDWEDNLFPTETFFISEPGVNIMLNITKFFRLGFGGSYRFISGVDTKYLNNKDLEGFSGVLTFKFGSF